MTTYRAKIGNFFKIKGKIQINKGKKQINKKKRKRRLLKKNAVLNFTQSPLI